MPTSVFDRLEALFKQHGITFEVLRHEPVYTSEEAARIRGTPLASGAKALVCKGDETFVMFVLPADRKLDSRTVRRAKGWRKLRFATRDEVLQLTGLLARLDPAVRQPVLPAHPLRPAARGERGHQLQRRRPQRLGEHALRGLRAGRKARIGHCSPSSQ